MATEVEYDLSFGYPLDLKNMSGGGSLYGEVQVNNFEHVVGGSDRMTDRHTHN